MPNALLRSGRVIQTARQLSALAGNDAVFLPTLVLVVVCESDVLIVKYQKGGFMLPQGRIFEREQFEYVAWRILTNEFGMKLPDPRSNEWNGMVTRISLFHQNKFDSSRSATGVAGKMMTFCRVDVPSRTVNLDTAWNRSRETNPPLVVHWAPVTSHADLEVLSRDYFSSMRTEEKREAEISIIATALGIRMGTTH